MIISFTHPELKSYRIVIENQEFNNQPANILLVDSVMVQIYFEPYKIKPLLRIDNILVNYWLADVAQYDHMLEFTISNDFWIKYYNKETQNQINFAKTNYKNDPMAVDKYVGIFDSSKLIKTIRDRLIG
jgi:hypothetical protein